MPAFACRLCGECCLGRGGVRLDEAGAARAAAFLGLGLSEFKAAFLAGGGPPWDILCGDTGRCLFSQEDGRCLVHPVKPEICRAWPYLPGPLSRKSAFLEAKEACPGISRDLSWEEFKAGHGPLPR